jgi:putative transposase
MGIVVRHHWTQGRKLRTLAQRTKGRELARRTLAIAWLMAGRPVSEIADALAAARSTVYRWIRWLHHDGINGLFRDQGRCSPSTVTDELLEALAVLVEDSPQLYGYLRASWTSELLLHTVHQQHGLVIHPATVRRALHAQGWRWRRARPTLFKRDHSTSYCHRRCAHGGLFR